MQHIPIVLASDDNYIQHLGVTMCSILENTNSQIQFHLLLYNVTDQNINKVKQIQKTYNTQVFYNIITDQRLESFPEIGRLKKSAYLRLFIEEILPKDIKKLIYLDVDTVVLGDIVELYKINLNGKIIGAIKDYIADYILRIYFYKGLNSYFNSGVMVIDFQKWQEFQVLKKSVDFIKKYKNYLMTADQDVLNCLFINQWQEIEKKFNTVLIYNIIDTMLKENTVILHYIDKIKPWSYLYIEKNKKFYFQYLQKTPWRGFFYSDKNYTNRIKKYGYYIHKHSKLFLRKIIPIFLIDIYHKYIFKKQYKVNTNIDIL